MKIKQLLIAPASRLIPAVHPWWLRIKNVLVKPAVLYDGELHFYGDLPQILGADNCYILGGWHPQLNSAKLPANCPYPSSHGTPAGTAIHPNELSFYLNKVDAVLLSTRSPLASVVIAQARSRDLPIAMIDFPDHEELYGHEAPPLQLFRGYTPKSDFDLFFKKDLPLALQNDYLQPLAPSPIRPSSYQFISLPQNSPVFYSGRTRSDRVQPERSEVVDLIEKHYPSSVIIRHENRRTFLSTQRYWDFLSSTKLALSPSGRVWDSYRHCEVGLTPATALIAPEPYIATAGTPLVDGVNAILYQVNLIDGQYHLSNSSQLLEKIQHYLTHQTQLLNLARRWRADVIASHTVLARSQFIHSAMEENF